MMALSMVVANLERQRAVYVELEAVLAQQRAALTARDTEALDAANGRQARLADALGTLEAERLRLTAALPGAPLRLRDLLDLAGEGNLRDRLLLLRDQLPPLVERVQHLTRTNRALAADAGASAAHLLGLLGLAEAPGYEPATCPARRSRPSLRLDVQA